VAVDRLEIARERIFDRIGGLRRRRLDVGRRRLDRRRVGVEDRWGGRRLFFGQPTTTTASIRTTGRTFQLRITKPPWLNPLLAWRRDRRREVLYCSEKPANGRTVAVTFATLRRCGVVVVVAAQRVAGSVAARSSASVSP
jgi:hypothetical protein